ncbi:translocon-associated protein subunit alpha-like [Oscarella lobularis]|uniref:translocon-associated protein subunit alpha-like n=1 Tax=Oscarella lobularis TaxID=121494 RepID=UPI0033132F0C
MFKLLSKCLLLFLIAFPVTILIGQSGIVVRAAEDEVEGEDERAGSGASQTGADDDDDDDDDTTIEEEKEGEEGEEGKSPAETAGDEVSGEEEEDEVPEIKPSPDADTTLLFTKYNEKQLPAGKLATVLTGFENTGDKDFIVDNLEASLRYPQDYSYFIQNFTLGMFDTLVVPGEHRSFLYQFTPGDSLGGRSFILVIALNYRNSDGSEFRDAVFNDTVEFYEVDEGLDAETFFLYILFAAALGLVVILIYNFVPTGSKRKSAPKVEVGTQGDDEVDKSWLPMDHLNANGAPTRSPRKRKTKN